MEDTYMDDIIEESDLEAASWWIKGSLMETIWMMGRTSKPFATVPMYGEDVNLFEAEARADAAEVGVKLHIDWARNEDGEADITYPAAQFCFYREDCMLELHNFLGGDWAIENIPRGIMDTLEGLMYGYRSDAIHANNQRVRRLEAQQRIGARARAKEWQDEAEQGVNA